METLKETGQRIASNHLTVMRTIMIQWLTSFFKNTAAEWGWNEDPLKSSLVVLDYRSDISGINEKSSRVIVKREPFSGQNKFTDNRTTYDNYLYTSSAVKPRLGYIRIFCESRNEILCDYIATRIEDILTLHKDDLLEKGMVIGEPSLSDINLPISGTGFYSVVVTIPTVINRETSFSVKDPSMLGKLFMELGIANVPQENIEVTT